MSGWHYFANSELCEHSLRVNELEEKSLVINIKLITTSYERLNERYNDLIKHNKTIYAK